MSLVNSKIQGAPLYMKKSNELTLK